MINEELISRATVAEIMGLTVDTIKWHRTYGKMPAPDYVVDNKPLWLRETIDEWIQQRTTVKRPEGISSD